MWEKESWLARLWIILSLFGLMFVAAALACGQESVPVEITGDTKKVQVDRVVVVKEDRLVVNGPFSLKAPTGGILYQWQHPAGWDVLRKGNVLEVKSATKGHVTVAVEFAVVDFDKRLVVTKFGSVSFDVGEVTPPDPPKPPEPPVPPIPVGALRVIFVAESGSKLTTEELHTWNSTRIAAYLDEKCVKDGSLPAWRKWDKDQVPSEKETAAMKQLWADSKNSVPVPGIIIAVGQKATVYPLPKEDETLAVLKKHAEGK